jgi:hypothetical protein
MCCVVVLIEKKVTSLRIQLPGPTKYKKTIIYYYDGVNIFTNYNEKTKDSWITIRTRVSFSATKPLHNLPLIVPRERPKSNKL